LRPDPAKIYEEYVKNGADTVAKARIETHYFVHGCFFERSEQVIEDAKILKEHKIPGVIIHGRYDLVCQPRVACMYILLFPPPPLVLPYSMIYLA
jgi:proline iminopeptidase